MSYELNGKFAIVPFAHVLVFEIECNGPVEKSMDNRFIHLENEGSC